MIALGKILLGIYYKWCEKYFETDPVAYLLK